MKTVFDVIIIGGGLVGSTLALALANSHLRVALVEARTPNLSDPRLFGLNDSSCQLLKNLKLWPLFEAYTTPIKRVHVSYQKHFGAVRLDCNQINKNQLGVTLPASYLEAALDQALRANDRLSYFCPAECETVELDKTEIRVILRYQQEKVILTGAFLFGADGASSRVRALLNYSTRNVQYQQTAIVTKTALQQEHHFCAYERFLPEGAIAMLPMQDNHCATIWTCPKPLAEDLHHCSDEVFIARLQEAFGYRLGLFQAIGKRHQFPLQMITLVNNPYEHVYLLGNAAHTLHPIAAQGLNLSLYEVASIVDVVSSIHPFTSHDFHRALKKQQQFSGYLSHYLSQLFSMPETIKNKVIPLGMMGFDLLLPLKKKFIEKILGHAGYVPSLLGDHYHDKYC